MPTNARRLRQVQIRTTAIAMVSVVVMLTLGALGLVELFERAQVRRIDASLDRSLDLVEAAVVAGELRGTPNPNDLVQLVDQAGNVVFASDLLEGKPALWIPNDERADRDHRTIAVSGVGSVRIAQVRIDDNWLLMGGSLGAVDEATAALKTTLLLGLPTLAAALAFVVWIVVGRTLQPVRRSIEREEQLVADVSHELRSPIAGMRLLLESEPTDHDELHLNRLDSLATLRRLEAIADGLLTVSRQDGVDASVAGELVDLDEVVLDVVDRLALRADVSFDCSAVQAAQVRGSEGDLDRMVDNLLSNAARHATSSVRIGVCEQEGTVVVTVSDDGAGIPLSSRSEIFERFTRLDEARARDNGGVGLGLSIVHAVVSSHGGSIAVDGSEAGGAEFIVRIPSSTPKSRYETDQRGRLVSKAARGTPVSSPTFPRFPTGR